MPLVRELLDAASPARISEIHAERLGRTGIVQRSQMRQQLEDWLRDPSRMEDLSPDRKDLLVRLAFAGPDGLSRPEGPVDELARDLMAFRRSESEAWHGLDDWGRVLRHQWLSSREEAIPARADRIPAPRAFVEGIAALSARIDLGAARLTRTGEINRRDRPKLREAFFHVEEFGEQAQDDALDLALEFLSGRDLLLVREGALECHPDLLATLSRPGPLAEELLRWWIRRAFGERDEVWTDLSGSHLSGADAARAWSWRDDHPLAASLRWPQLPPSLRQAIAVGGLEARADNGSLASTGPTPEDLPAPERPATATADLLVYLAPMAPPSLRRRMESVAVREAVGLVTRYRLSREAVLEAAAHPVLGEEIQRLLEELDPPPSVRRVVEEWLQARRTCQFETARLLRVRDPHRHKELAALPAVSALVRETIPEWGFLVDPSREPELRRVLQALGYDPPEPPSADIPCQAWAPVPVPAAGNPSGEWLLDRPEEELRRQPLSTHSKYGDGLKELPFQDLLRVVEYAALTDAEIEVVLKGGPQRPARLRVVRIHKRKEPVSLEVRTAGGREDREIPLDSVRKIRLCG